MESQSTRRVSEKIKETNCFSGTSLLFATLSSVVCSAIVPVLGAGKLPTVAGAIVTPLVVSMFTTKGRIGLIRTVGMALLTAFAAIVTISGFTVPEAIAGEGSLTSAGTGTFVDTERKPTPTPPAPFPATHATTGPRTTGPSTHPATHPRPIVKLTPSRRRCPDAEVGETVTCKQIGITNAGATTFEVSTGELEGDQDDFTLTKVCHKTLKRGKSCSIQLEFHPTGAGAREVAVVVHVKPGGIAQRVGIWGNATESSAGPTPEPSSSPPPTPVPCDDGTAICWTTQPIQPVQPSQRTSASPGRTTPAS
ncbi:hypothetical protein AB0E69_15775 [Kribbella sp. NPDC026611]|uniref:hypothetical protein n=1 Tax=Kribbella sp. NPDC026611 TaxID=3154911 RepID=UPI0033F0E100